jgi:uncharacterized protein YaaN involved in tellurite resistance
MEHPIVSAGSPGLTIERTQLTPADEEKIVRYKTTINLAAAGKSHIIQYGAEAQHKMVSFSETVLSQVRNKDVGEVGDILSGLVTNLRTFDKSIHKPGILSFFQSLKKKILRIKAEYTKIEKNVVQVEHQLERHYQTLLKDIHLFDKLYEQNEQCFKDLSLYIYAGEDKLAETDREKLSDTEKAQLHQFEKKLHDLKLSRMISFQLAPQIRLVQSNSIVLMEKIQSSIVNTLPLWRNQMVLALGLVHTQQALEAQRAVTEATNQLLRRNSEILHTSSAQIAKENERSIVDVETLQKVNTELFATINDVMAIQQEGRQKRLAAEKELLTIEHEWREKLNEIPGSRP